MEPAAKPVCPLCGGVVADGICDFLYSPSETPSQETVPIKVIRYKCDCGYKFSVVAFQAQWPLEESSQQDDSDAKGS